MSKKEQITKAIGAHGMWKARLNMAIDKGSLDKKVEEIRQDNCCEFGQWLYSNDLSQTDKASKYYQDVKALHAQFHEIAANVAELATKGEREKAQNKLDGEYKLISSDLTRKMMAWMTA